MRVARFAYVSISVCSKTCLNCKTSRLKITLCGFCCCCFFTLSFPHRVVRNKTTSADRATSSIIIISILLLFCIICVFPYRIGRCRNCENELFNVCNDFTACCAQVGTEKATITKSKLRTERALVCLVQESNYWPLDLHTAACRPKPASLNSHLCGRR